MDTTAARRLLSGPIQAHVLGAPDPPRRFGGVDELVMFPALPEALDWVLDMLDHHERVRARLTCVSPGSGSVGIMRIRGKQLLLLAAHFIGEGRESVWVPHGEAEGKVAALLADRDYRQVVLSGAGTPLMTLKPLLPLRVLNLLLREDFSSVEQVAVVPDDVLRELPGMGILGLGALRAAIASIGVVTTSEGTGPVTFSGQQADDLARLLDRLAAFAHVHGEHTLAEQASAFTRLLTGRSV